MILVIAELSIPTLAFLALGKIVKDPAILSINKKYLYISLSGHI